MVEVAYKYVDYSELFGRLQTTYSTIDYIIEETAVNFITLHHQNVGTG